jgi:hypothetical protein
MKEIYLQIRVAFEDEQAVFSNMGRARLNQADAHFTGLLMCPVCKKETRHYIKDTHESPVAKISRIWCEDCRVVQMQFRQSCGKWE